MYLVFKVVEREQGYPWPGVEPVEMLRIGLRISAPALPEAMKRLIHDHRRISGEHPD